MKTKLRIAPTDDTDAAAMTPAQLDDHIALIRVPLLRERLAEIVRQSRAAYLSKVSPTTYAVRTAADRADKVLLGTAAPVAPAEPDPEVALTAERAEVELALHRAQPYIARSEERRYAAVVARFLDEINELERGRIFCAIELQRLNRAREELRTKITDAGGGAVSLHTDGYDMLGLGDVQDEVGYSAERLLRAGVITPREIENAKRGKI